MSPTPTFVSRSIPAILGVLQVQERIVTSTVRQMTHSGVNLTDSAKERFNALQIQLAELSTKFSNNLLDATQQFSLTITGVCSQY